MHNVLRLTFVLVFLFFQSALVDASPAFDPHDPEWREFLQKYVREGLVDYAAVKKSPGSLDSFLKSAETVSQVEYRSWSREQQIAFWINAYNASAVKMIVDHYPLKKGLSWKAVAYPKNSIQQIPNAWNREILSALGKKISLNEIENEKLRKEFQEPRIHFTLVCCSLGCPVLRGEPYEAEQLDFQLNDQTRRFLANPLKVRYDQNTDILYLSPIFKWFKKDFEKSGSVINFLKNYLPRETMNKISDRTKMEWLDYDWRLNEENFSG